MEVWLSKASQCPTCRVPITPDNPCKEIIGATNEGDTPTSPTMKRHLRKTRGELLLKEYEDEIESLARENEELRNKNRATETQLETFLEPRTVSVSGSEDRSLDIAELEEWAGKLRAATDLYEKVKQDVEKLKEANKTLRAQNVDLVQENMRLKAEVESRSPQKYGRYTVAALEAKIQQHERDMAHLKRALERSDQYIEELEAQRDSNTGASGSKEEAHSEGSPAGDGQTGRPSGHRIVTMRRSLSRMEETSVCTDLGGEPSGFCSDQGLLLTTMMPSKTLLRDAATPHRDTGDTRGRGFVSPTTPSTALGSLSLRSPLGRARPGCGQGRGPLSYLRRLSFDGCGSSEAPRTDKPAASKTSMQASLMWLTQQSHGEGDSAAESPNITHTSACGRRASSEACMDAAYQEKMSELDSLISDGEGPPPSAHLTLPTPGHRNGLLTPGTTDSALASIDQTSVTSADATQRLGADTQDSRQEMTDRPDVTPGTSFGMRSSASSSSSTSSLAAQVSKRRCSIGPLTSSPSKMSKCS